jgi:GNAT superfamily N-acetyltransferase
MGTIEQEKNTVESISTEEYKGQSTGLGGNDDGYIIQQYSDQHKDGFLSLYRTVFRDTSHEWFQWKYENNPYVDSVPIYVATKEGEVVGASPFFALKLAIDGREFLTLQPADAMVHPDHRKNGLLSRMTEHAIDFYADRSPAMFFNFPNWKSKGAYLKHDWKVVDELSTYYRIQNPARVVGMVPDSTPRSFVESVGKAIARTYHNVRNQPNVATDNNIRINQHQSIPVSEFVALSGGGSTDKLQLVRDEAFYKWRYNSPNWSYTSYLAKQDGVPIAGMITGTSVENGTIVTKLTDIVPSSESQRDSETMSLLLSQVVRDFDDSDVLAARRGSLSDSLLQQYGFWSDDQYPLSLTSTRTTHVARSLSDDLGINLHDSSKWESSFALRDTN